MANLARSTFNLSGVVKAITDAGRSSGALPNPWADAADLSKTEVVLRGSGLTRV